MILLIPIHNRCKFELLVELLKNSVLMRITMYFENIVLNDNGTCILVV